MKRFAKKRRKRFNYSKSKALIIQGFFVNLANILNFLLKLIKFLKFKLLP